MNRDVLKIALFLGALLVAILCLASCGAPKPQAKWSPWDHAETRADDIGNKVLAAATQVSGSASEIITDARDGRNATPVEVRPTLDPFWSRIVANGQMILVQSDALNAVRKEIDSLRTEVKAGQKQLADQETALAAEKTGRAADNKAWETKLTKANSQWERMFQTISWLAIIAIGISVTVGVLMHDFRISIAGGAGGLAVVLACMVVGQIQHWLPWIAGGLVALLVLWVLIETLVRGSFTAAIKTTPLQDVKDLLTPATVAPTRTPLVATAPLGPVSNN